MHRFTFYIIFLIFAVFASCKKESKEPAKPVETKIPVRISFSGVRVSGLEEVKSYEFWTDTVYVRRVKNCVVSSAEDSFDFVLEADASHIERAETCTVRLTTDKAMYTRQLEFAPKQPVRADMSEARRDCGPFGWGCCSSLKDAEDYVIDGAERLGTRALKIVLTSTGAPMSDEVKRAIENYDIIVFDGSKGKFMFDRCIEVSVSDKTIYGINNAVCETVFYLTPEIQAIFDENEIMSIPLTEGEMLTLPNGKQTNRYRHYLTRLLLMQYTGDLTEFHLRAGFIRFNTCENIILRNITFIGGGAYSLLDNYSNITLRVGSRHIWMDHCTVQDGCDGNFDMGGATDFVTVTWCKFAYGPRSYASFISNLAGNDENLPSEEDHFNTTYAYCEWPETPDAERIPHARYGRMHVFNCYYPTNKLYSQGIQGGYHSRFLVENNYFEHSNRFFRDSGKTYGYILRGNRTPGEGQNTSFNENEISIPYKYTALPAESVKELVTSPQGVGPTLQLHEYSY